MAKELMDHLKKIEKLIEETNPHSQRVLKFRETWGKAPGNREKLLAALRQHRRLITDHLQDMEDLETDIH